MEIFAIGSQDALVRINNYAALNAIQSLDWQPNLNEETYSELGNEDNTAQSIAPELSGSFESTATGSTVAFLKRMIQDFDPVTHAFRGYKAGDPATADNEGTIRHRDLEFACFDLSEVKKPNDIFDRTTLFPRAYLSGISFSASVDGTATETYSFEGDLLRIYPAPYHDVISLPVSRTSSTSVEVPAGYSIDVPGGLLGGTDWVLAGLFVDEQQIETAALAVAENSGTYTVTITDGRTIANGARVQIIAYRAVPGAAPTIEYPTSSRFTKADQIDVWLVPTSSQDIVAALDNGDSLNDLTFSEEDFWLRVQNSEMNLDLSREPLRQIKRTNNRSSVYHRKLNYPIPVTGSVTVLETNFSDWRKMQGLPAPTSGDDYLELGKFENRTFQLVVRYYYLGTTVQTMVMLDARVAGRGSRIGVGSNSEISWSFNGSQWAVSGSNV